MNLAKYFIGKPIYAKEVVVLKRTIGLKHVIQLTGRTKLYELVLQRYDLPLWDYLMEGRTSLTLAQKCDLMLGCARAVAELHDHDIVHRDLSIRNFMIDKDSHDITVIDLECRYSGLDVAPPEMPENADSYENKEGDIYAFGKLMWTIVQCNYPRALEELKLKTPFNSLLQKCRQMSPSNRPTIHQVIEELQSIGHALRHAST